MTRVVVGAIFAFVAGVAPGCDGDDPKPEAPAPGLVEARLRATAATRDLSPGADVRVAGVNVGTVEQVELTDSSVHIGLRIEPEYSPIDSSARVILRRKTLLSDEIYVELAPPGAESTPSRDP